ncbi:MAG: hypothetical protein R3308_01430 [Thiohalobacterales bacterium]|nr:hypothetical protein [Thiohalobacterales bacterium]
MSTTAAFAYMQTRLQAHHGRRPDEQVWLQLQGTSGLANYLQAARRTPLLPWVSGLQPDHDTHAIERSLRRQFRTHVGQVARWLPADWAASIRWITLLPDLPALQHLLKGEAAPAWMLENPRLRPYTSENPSLRLQALQTSGWREIVRAWQTGTPPVEAWLDCWRRQWPASRRLHAGLQHLCGLYRSNLAELRTAPADTAQQRALLAGRLRTAFRRFSFQPAAACAHLGLVALDLERLRAELVSRALFPDRAGVDA